MVFRTRAEVQPNRQDAGCELDAVHSDWAATPFAGMEPIMVFVAQAG